MPTRLLTRGRRHPGRHAAGTAAARATPRSPRRSRGRKEVPLPCPGSSGRSWWPTSRSCGSCSTRACPSTRWSSAWKWAAAWIARRLAPGVARAADALEAGGWHARREPARRLGNRARPASRVRRASRRGGAGRRARALLGRAL